MKKIALKIGIIVGLLSFIIGCGYNTTTTHDNSLISDVEIANIVAKQNYWVENEKIYPKQLGQVLSKYAEIAANYDGKGDDKDAVRGFLDCYRFGIELFKSPNIHDKQLEQRLINVFGSLETFNKTSQTCEIALQNENIKDKYELVADALKAFRATMQ